MASTRAQEQIIEVDVRNSAQAVESARSECFQLVKRARTPRCSSKASSVCTRWAVRRRSFCSSVKTRWRMRASELRAETDYNKAFADLQRATSTTLRANNVVVDAPTVHNSFQTCIIRVS